jgi:hypothetical protein
MNSCRESGHRRPPFPGRKGNGIGVNGTQNLMSNKQNAIDLLDIGHDINNDNCVISLSFAPLKSRFGTRKIE